MKRRALSLFLVMSMALSSTGCASAQAWYTKLQTDPIAALNDVTSVMRIAMNAAQIAFDIWANSASPADVTSARLAMDPLQGNVNAGLAVAQTGLHIAANLRQANPDVDALFNDTRSAMTDLNSFISGLTQRAGRAASPEMARAVVLTAQASTYHTRR